MHFLKKIVMLAIIGTVIYFLMGYHYIFIGKSVKMLKKSEYTLKYTIFSTKGKTIEKILSVRELWDDGIGDLLLENGLITEEQLAAYQQKMDEKE